jgi:hypothetical protein
MKLLFENWRRYTNSILNEDLLIESVEEAYETIKKRSTKLLKGWSYDKYSTAYNEIEQKIQNAIKNTLGTNPSQEQINKFENAWDIGGTSIAELLRRFTIPKDITDKQKSIALLWNYKQLTKNKIIKLDSFLENVVIIINEFNNNFLFPSSSLISSSIMLESEMASDEFIKLHVPVQKPYFVWYYPPVKEDNYPQRSQLIENFFHWNNFIRDGKKDLNAVADYDELYELIEEARPLYMAWQEKQSAKDAKEEVLLNNEDWEIKILLNIAAARIFGKRSDLCTAAPGLNYFDTYSKPNDPLIAITNKKINKRYQFNFGKNEFQYLRPEEKDQKVCFKQTPLNKKELEEIMKVLAKVIPKKYEVPYTYLKKYKN